MKYYCEEPILQSEKFVMATGATIRIQIKESSYMITLNLDTDMYRDLKMNTFKKGVRISSTLKKFPREKISKEIFLTRDLDNLSQLTEDIITIEDKYYSLNIVVKLLDFIRSDVKKACEKYFLLQKCSIE